VARAKARADKAKTAKQEVAVSASATPPYTVKGGVIEPAGDEAQPPAEQRPFGINARAFKDLVKSSGQLFLRSSGN
jgi:hypothetical protein